MDAQTVKDYVLAIGAVVKMELVNKKFLRDNQYKSHTFGIHKTDVGDYIINFAEVKYFEDNLGTKADVAVHE